MQKNTIVTEKVNTSDDIAARLHVSKNIVQRELREGKLKGVKRFGKWYVLESSLIEYLS